MINYDNLNAAYSSWRALRQSYLDGIITEAELAAQVVKIKADIKEILGIPAPQP